MATAKGNHPGEECQTSRGPFNHAGETSGKHTFRRPFRHGVCHGPACVWPGGLRSISDRQIEQIPPITDLNIQCGCQNRKLLNGAILAVTMEAPHAATRPASQLPHARPQALCHRACMFHRRSISTRLHQLKRMRPLIPQETWYAPEHAERLDGPGSFYFAQVFNFPAKLIQNDLHVGFR